MQTYIKKTTICSNIFITDDDDDGNNDSHEPHFCTILTRYHSAYLVIQCIN